MNELHDSIGPSPADGPLLVGVDWSDNARHAARWAAAIGRSLDREVIVVHAMSPWVGLEMAVPPFDFEEYESAVQSSLDEWASSLDPVPTEILVQDEAAHALLLQVSKVGAGMLVVGAHPHHAWSPKLLGSVTSKVLHGAEVPVAVVPASADVTSIGDRIVVGVDGSASSLRALRWAAIWAHDLGLEMYLVCALPMEAYAEKPRLADFDSVDPVADTMLALRQLGHQITQETDVAVGSDIVVGHAAERLIAASRNHAALVVGKTGHSAFAEVVFGSTARSCATHSEVPVVVVP
jgi:nucleotide-binding universal stress UspA family protein